MKPERSAISLGTRLRWLAFRWLEKLSGGTPAHCALPSGPAKPALWVFVSTIGELNAIAPFLRQLVAQHAELQLVLLTDRSIYRDSYLAQYPQADVIEISSHSAPAATLAALRPPKLFIVAEIPGLPADAPCRLPFGYLYQARRAGARIALVNGWLYGYTPSCRIDHIERQLLGASYLSLFDVLCVQNQDVAAQLIKAGADKNRLHITGNIKFDALDSQVRPAAQCRSPLALQSVEASTRHIIVAGCVTDDEERDLVLDAFTSLRQSQPNALLVLAPRHPENANVMAQLAQALHRRQLTSRLHSQGDAAITDALDVLVLNTMGELRDFYARAHIAHVGRDHNVLEPLAFGKMVTVRPGWNSTYPSYPVFCLAQSLAVISASSKATELAQHWHSATQRATEQNPTHIALKSASGATAKTLTALNS